MSRSTSRVANGTVVRKPGKSCSHPETAERLLAEAQQEADRRFRIYQELAAAPKER